MKMLLLAALCSGQGTVIARDANQPFAAIDGKGNVYVVFLKDGNVGIAVSNDRGKSFSSPKVAMDGKGKARGGMQRGPRVAVDGKGTIYVTAPLCFDPAEFSKRYPTQDLYLATSTDGGKTFSKLARVNDVPKKAPESLHWLAASEDGAHVAWLDLRLNRPRNQSLAYAKIVRGKVGRNLIASAGPLCECCAPGLAVDGKGNPILAYREGGTKRSREIFLALSRNGGRSFGRPARVNRGATGAAT